MRILHFINAILYIGYLIILTSSLISYVFNLSNELIFIAILAHGTIGIAQPLLAIFALFFNKEFSAKSKKKFAYYLVFTISVLIILAIISEVKPTKTEFVLILFTWVIPFFLASYFTHVLYEIDKYDLNKEKPLN